MFGNATEEKQLESGIAHGVPPRRTRWASFLLGVLFAAMVAVLFGAGSYVWSAYRSRDLLVFSYRLDLARIMQGDPDTFWSLKPNLKNELFQPQPNGPPVTFHVSTNELGLRNPPIGEKGNRVRILAIGDSTTFGQYVEDDESWPAQLQKMLDPDAKHIEVINAGLIGTSSFQGLCYCVKRGFALKPDIIIATYGFNDRGKWNLSDRVSLAPNAKPGFKYLLPLFWRWNTQYEQSFETRPRVSPGEYLDALIALAQTCKEHKVQPYFVVWPVPSQLTGSPDLVNGPDGPYQSLTLEAATRTSTPVIDVRKPLHDAPQPILLDIVHASAAGCRVVAETAAAALHTYSPEAFRTEQPAGS